MAQHSARPTRGGGSSSGLPKWLKIVVVVFLVFVVFGVIGVIFGTPEQHEANKPDTVAVTATTSDGITSEVQTAIDGGLKVGGVSCPLPSGATARVSANYGYDEATGSIKDVWVVVDLDVAASTSMDDALDAGTKLAEGVAALLADNPLVQKVVLNCSQPSSSTPALYQVIYTAPMPSAVATDLDARLDAASEYSVKQWTANGLRKLSVSVLEKPAA